MTIHFYHVYIREDWHARVEQCLIVGVEYHASRLALVRALPLYKDSCGQLLSLCLNTGSVGVVELLCLCRNLSFAVMLIANWLFMSFFFSLQF